MNDCNYFQTGNKHLQLFVQQCQEDNMTFNIQPDYFNAYKSFNQDDSTRDNGYFNQLGVNYLESNPNQLQYQNMKFQLLSNNQDEIPSLETRQTNSIYLQSKPLVKLPKEVSLEANQQQEQQSTINKKFDKNKSSIKFFTNQSLVQYDKNIHLQSYLLELQKQQTQLPNYNQIQKFPYQRKCGENVMLSSSFDHQDSQMVMVCSSSSELEYYQENKRFILDIQEINKFQEIMGQDDIGIQSEQEFDNNNNQPNSNQQIQINCDMRISEAFETKGGYADPLDYYPLTFMQYVRDLLGQEQKQIINNQNVPQHSEKLEQNQQQEQRVYIEKPQPTNNLNENLCSQIGYPNQSREYQMIYLPQQIDTFQKQRKEYIFDLEKSYCSEVDQFEDFQYQNNFLEIEDRFQIQQIEYGQIEQIEIGSIIPLQSQSQSPKQNELDYKAELNKMMGQLTIPKNIQIDYSIKFQSSSVCIEKKENIQLRKRKQYLFDQSNNKLKNFYKNIMKPIIKHLKELFMKEKNLEIIQFITQCFPTSCNQKHFLLLFNNFQELIEQSQKNIWNRLESTLSQKQLTDLEIVRQKAVQVFGNKFYHLLRTFNRHKSSKNIEEYYYGIIFFSDRSSKQQYAFKNGNDRKQENIFTPVVSNLRQRLYTNQQRRLKQEDLKDNNQ